ncbi:hypothetical protein EPO56_00800 [Patescibacteria group bacterium]|nr:MAG: hypothetical protein EPO56_00800 [Patescibacteria group bacterium]
MSASKKRLLTGIQSSGALHVGNYMGALKPFLELYEEHDSLLMIADYHALTSLKNPKELARNTLDVAKDYLAIGLDPSKAILFKQSDVPEHTELAWIFNCLVTVPFLMQSHAYKDKVAKGLEANAGLFTYPMLMASDILLYDTAVVPVGEDQRQHIEYALKAARILNIDILGFDMIWHNGKPIIIDVNTFPGFYEELFKEIGREPSREFFKVIEKHLR